MLYRNELEEAKICNNLNIKNWLIIKCQVNKNPQAIVSLKKGEWDKLKLFFTEYSEYKRNTELENQWFPASNIIVDSARH